MNLILQNNRIVASINGPYQGPDLCVPAPEGFSFDELAKWDVVDGAVVITSASLARFFTGALDAHYDAKAAERNYDTRYTCALRAGYAGPFQAEGVAFAGWMDACNAQCYALMAAVQAGTETAPASSADLIASLPALVWPG